MKNYIILLFFVTLNCYSQLNSGKVLYSVKVNPSSHFHKNEGSVDIKEATNKINNIIPTLEFDLVFNKEKSLFNLKKQLALDLTEFHSKMAILISQGNKTIFCDIQNKILLEQISFNGEDFIIKSSIDDFKWSLTKEEKLIGKYLCYKAVAFKEMKIQNKLKKFYYTAWYCPEIPFSFGPANINGLPGMVLELSNKHLIYYAKKIELSKTEIVVEAPEKGKMMTKKDFENIGKSAFENINN